MHLMSDIKQWINSISFHMLKCTLYHKMIHCWLFTVTYFIVLFYSVFLVASWTEGTLLECILDIFLESASPLCGKTKGYTFNNIWLLTGQKNMLKKEVNFKIINLTFTISIHASLIRTPTLKIYI